MGKGERDGVRGRKTIKREREKEREREREREKEGKGDERSRSNPPRPPKRSEEGGGREGVEARLAIIIHDIKLKYLGRRKVSGWRPTSIN